jgi:hypothetical protein
MMDARVKPGHDEKRDLRRRKSSGTASSRKFCGAIAQNPHTAVDNVMTGP